MSDHYVFSFAFDLGDDGDLRVVSAFEALARCRDPDAADLEAFPRALSDAFLTVATLQANRPTVGSPVSIWSRELLTMDDRPVLQRHLRLSLIMHDDWYANGGWVVPFALFDLVGQPGTFGQHRTEEGRGQMLYHRRGTDLVVIGIDIADRPGAPLDVAVRSTTYVHAAQRAAFLAQADAAWP